MTFVAEQHIKATDHDLWCNNLSKVYKRLLNELENNNIPILKNNVLLGECWDKSIRNCSVVFFNFSDIVWDDTWMNDLEKVGEKYNIKFTLLTDVFYQGNNNFKNIKVLFLKELFGVYYNPYISSTTIRHYDKLYTCLLQRTSYSRLKLFSTLADNNLLDNSNVSLLGFQINNNKSAINVVKTLNDMYGEFNHIVDNFNFPFRNFKDKTNCFEIEETSKFIIALETYNENNYPNWIAFTEKTFRGLQIPNISLLLNKKGSIRALNSINIQTHPINAILDHMETIESQNNFIIGILLNDSMFTNELNTQIATHNQNQLKEWYDTLQSDEFYVSIINNIN